MATIKYFQDGAWHTVPIVCTEISPDTKVYSDQVYMEHFNSNTPGDVNDGDTLSVTISKILTQLKNGGSTDLFQKYTLDTDGTTHIIYDSMVFAAQKDAKGITVAFKVPTSFSSTIDASAATDINTGASNLHGSLWNCDDKLTTKTFTATGDATIKGIADITGALSAHSTATIDGATEVKDTLTVDKDATFKAGVDITGALAAHGVVTIDGATEIKDSLTVDKNSVIKGNEDVYGTLTAHGDFAIDGSLDIGDSLTVEKNATIKGTEDINGQLNAHGNVLVDGTTELKDVLTADEDINTKGNLDVAGTITGHSTATFDSDAEVKGNLTVDKNTTTKGNDSVTGTLTVSGKATFTAGADVRTGLNMNTAPVSFQDQDTNKVYHQFASVDKQDTISKFILGDAKLGLTVHAKQAPTFSADGDKTIKTFAFVEDVNTVEYPIAENTDMHTLIKPGIYACDTDAIAATLKNAPTKLAFIMELVINDDQKNLVHRLTELSTGNVYIETLVGTTWTAWTASGSGSLKATPIDENTDLDTLVADGWYYCATNDIATTLKNCPIKNIFNMEIIPYNTDTKMQRINDIVGSTIYMRYLKDDKKTWTPWKAIGGSDASGIYFNTMKDLTDNGTNGLTYDTTLRILGYYKKYDYGGADYICKYIYSQEAYPWAVDLGATTDPEYELVYKKDGTPELDDQGDYVVAKDANGKPIPLYESDGKTPKMKHLYACIAEATVNYAMFGAKLDGTTNDYQPIYLAHQYQKANFTEEPESGRKKYYIKVVNNQGIIHKEGNDPIICVGDIDLSGSKILLNDDNAAWFGFYVWGDNEEDYMAYEPPYETTQTYLKDNFFVSAAGDSGDLAQNSLLFLKEDPYAVRDDSGYLYTEPRYELMLHTNDGLMANPFTYDWNAPGGLEINSTLTDFNTHDVSTTTTNSHFTISYTKMPSSHYHFTGCEVDVKSKADSYACVIWCKCHNAHIKGFTFYTDSAQMHNTKFKNALIYVWGCYNTEVSDIVGFDPAGKMADTANGTSGYVCRATNCLNLHLHDISVQGYWGATAMNCVKNISFKRVNINRIDVHNYFYNLYIDNCNLFNHGIQIGEGRGIVQVTNCNFYVNKIAVDSYPNAHLVEFNLTYGRIFEGKLYIDNCNAYIKGADGNEFDACKIEFSPEAVSTLDSYKFPEVIIKNCYFHSYDADTYLVYFMIAGTRRCTTSTKGPSGLIDYCRDTGNDNKGTLVWKFVGRGIDWIADNGQSLDVVPGQFIRTYSTFTDSDNKTQFYGSSYFLITKAGTLPTPSASNAPTDKTGKEFTIGTATAKFVDRGRWESNRKYALNDYCYTEASNWQALYCYVCTAAGTSNGWRPIHLSGKVIEGLDQYPDTLDDCYWQYIDTVDKFVTKDFTPKMAVTKDQVILADGSRLYKVIENGTLTDIPPLSSAWLEPFNEGTATIEFIGQSWSAKAWWAQNAYCLSYNSNDVLTVYQLVDQDGTTSGSIPVQGNGRCVDGDIIWQNVTDAPTKGEWKGQTQYFEGDIVSCNGHNYKCVFDGRLELPHQTVIENCTTNMTTGGDVFAFYEKGTDVPTKFGPTGKWTIRVSNTEFYRFRDFTNGYFMHKDNPAPTIVEDSTGGGGTGNITKLSQLQNDTGFITIDKVPTKVSQLTNDSKFISTVGDGITLDMLAGEVTAKLLGSKNVTNDNIADSTIAAGKLNFTINGNDDQGHPLNTVDWANIINVPATFAPAAHTHKIADITDYKIDTALNDTSTNPVQNKVVNTEIVSLKDQISKIPDGSGDEY